MTLVFAKEATEAGIKEALQSGRTLAFANHILAGKEEYIKAIFIGSFVTEKLREESNRAVFNLSNISDITYYLEREGKILVLPARRITQIKLKKDDLNKLYTLKNCLTGSRENAIISLSLIIQ